MKPHDLLDTEDLAALLGVRPSSLVTMRSQPARHRSIDGLPEPLRLISGRPVWERGRILAWMAHKGTERPLTPSCDSAPQSTTGEAGPIF